MDTQRLFRSMTTLVALGALVSMGAVGCGSDNTQAPTVVEEEQDLVPPITPLGVSVVRADTDGVSVKWTPNTEPDLAGYHVYVYHPSPATDEDYDLASGTEPLSSSRFHYECDGVASQLWVRVTAVDVNGNESPLSPRVEVALNTDSDESVDGDPNTGDRPGLDPTPSPGGSPGGPGHNDSEQDGSK